MFITKLLIIPTWWEAGYAGGLQAFAALPSLAVIPCAALAHADADPVC